MSASVVRCYQCGFNSLWASEAIWGRRFWPGECLPVYLRYQSRRCVWYTHDDVIKWKHFPRYWSFVRGIHRSPVNSPHKFQWRGALMFYLICARINGWVNNREAGDLRWHRADYDITVMTQCIQYYWRDISALLLAFVPVLFVFP